MLLRLYPEAAGGMVKSNSLRLQKNEGKCQPCHKINAWMIAPRVTRSSSDMSLDIVLVRNHP